MLVTCTRCGRTAQTKDVDGTRDYLPDDWEGNIHYQAVCLGCQYAEWHPLCESIVDYDGERIDLSVIPREEIDWLRTSRCEYLDLSISWLAVEDPPASWTCPDCGGTEFIGVHRDYHVSGLRDARFATSFEEVDEE